MRLYVLCVLAGSGFLTACGGGGGAGGASPITPVIPEPTNDIAKLTANHSFSALGNEQKAVFDLRNGTVASTSSRAANLHVTYDAASKSYTVSLNSESATFGPSDLKQEIYGEARYECRTADGSQLLTLVTTPYSGKISNRYVGMGFWQRYAVENSRQNDRFSTFVYGFETPASANPRTGTARYGIDVMGVTDAPGYEPLVFQGAGDFDVDFMGGEFGAHAYLEERGLLTGSGVVGGGIELVASGRVASGDGSFAGHVTVGSSRATTVGDLSGRFFGPAAEEVGASFNASNTDGVTSIGSFTGQRVSASGVNLRMTDVHTPQLFFANGRALLVDRVTATGAVRNVSQIALVGQLDDRTNGNFSFGPGLSSMAGGAFTNSDIVQGVDDNFVDYKKTFVETDVRMQLYKIGSANTELALTYVTLGRWESRIAQGAMTEFQNHHFVYGLPTRDSMLTRRTGNARYEGVVYGAGANQSTGAIYDVRGTSGFDVDFSGQTYTGSLVLNGSADGQKLNFGRYDFNGYLYWNGNSTSIMDGDAQIGQVNTRFYGPTGEELAGDFHVYAPERVQAGGLVINGVTVARRR
ncbi:transferrin-binding protein-like solute binding protein [Brevundimonas diminuta]|uniref:transferrin-binding protein-like solute binding protein n=1 Tax=Brevundimonas diminuta TaxID=293 RepID=UPI00320962FD